MSKHISFIVLHDAVVFGEKFYDGVLNGLTESAFNQVRAELDGNKVPYVVYVGEVEGEKLFYAKDALRDARFVRVCEIGGVILYSLSEVALQVP